MNEIGGFYLPNEILMILQPRAIPEAIESLNKLDIEKVWFRGFNEPYLCEVLNTFIQETNYDYYWIIADDVIVSAKPLHKLRPIMYEGNVVTGYCKWHQESQYVNILHTPLKSCYGAEHPNYHFWKRLNNANNSRNQWVNDIPHPKPNKIEEQKRYLIYDIDIPQMCYSLEDLERSPTDIIESCFGGWSFTGASRDIWLNYPFQCSIKGCESDMNFAHRFVNEDGNIILTHKEADFEHLKNNQYILTKDWLVGLEAPLIYKGQGKIQREDIELDNIHFEASDFEPSLIDSDIVREGIHHSTIERN